MGLRQEKLGSQLRKELSDIFVQHKEWVGGQFLTITSVSITPDLSYATVYYSVFNAANKQAAVDAFEAYNKEIRRELAKRLKNNLKKIPMLTFFEDQTQDYMKKVDDLFDKIKKP